MLGEAPFLSATQYSEKQVIWFVLNSYEAIREMQARMNDIINRINGCEGCE